MIMRDIDVLCNRSGDLARMYYEENFTVLEWGRNSASLLLYHSCCDEKIPTLSELFEINRKSTLRRNFVEYLKEDDTWERFFDTKTEMLKANKDALADAVQDDILERLHYGDYEEMEMVCGNFGIFVEADKYELMSSRGYSQGDYVEVLVPDKWFKEGIQDEVDHLLWDAPISFRIDADGEDIVYEDMVLDDYYEWDKDDVMKKIEALNYFNDQELKYIESKLPEYPEYSY